MKFFSGLIAGIALSFALLAGAAVTTITTTAGEDARLVVAFGDYLHLGRSATQGEIKGAISVWVTGVVNNYEVEQAKRAIAISPIAPS